MEYDLWLAVRVAASINFRNEVTCFTLLKKRFLSFFDMRVKTRKSKQKRKGEEGTDKGKLLTIRTRFLKYTSLSVYKSFRRTEEEMLWE